MRKNQRTDCIVGAKEQCYNREAGRAHVLPGDKYEKYNHEMSNNLSGGQQQRVAIARALVAKPAIVLADEPTGNLDSKTSADVLGLLQRTSREFDQTLVMITHNNAIAQLADRIVRIEDGKIVG